MVVCSRDYERDGQKDRGRDRDWQDVINPTIAATACVALWTVLHHSEQARALVRREEGFGPALVSLLQDGMLSQSGSRSRSVTVTVTASNRDRVNTGVQLSSGVTADVNSDNADRIASTTVQARTALLHLMDSA